MSFLLLSRTRSFESGWSDREWWMSEALAAGHGQNGAGNVGAVIGRQQYVGRGEFRRLSGPAQGRVLAEAGELVRPFGRRDQRRPDGAGSDGVDPDALGPKFLRQSFGERHLGRLGHG